MHHLSNSAFAANIADSYAAREDLFADTPEVAGLAIDSALCDLLAWENDGGDPEDWPGFGWDEDAYIPSAYDEAEWLGMSLQLEGEPTAEIDTENTSFLLRFAVGQLRGLEARQDAEREEREYDAWLAERERDAFGDPADRIHDCERTGIC